MFYSVVIPGYQTQMELSPGGAEPADHSWNLLQSRNDTIITWLGLEPTSWGCHKSNSSWQQTALFAWLFFPSLFQVSEAGNSVLWNSWNQSLGAPGAQAGKELLQGSSARQTASETRTFPSFNLHKGVGNVRGLFRILIKPQLGESESSTKRNIPQENGVVLFAKHFVSLHWMTSEHWLLFGLCCETARKQKTATMELHSFIFPKV